MVSDPKVELPRAALFTRLRQLWIERYDAPDIRATSASLAAKLGLSRQKITDYASGARPAPDWVLNKLARECDVELRLREDGVMICPARLTAGDVIPWSTQTTEPV